MKRISFLLILGIFALLLVGGYTGYIFWQKGNVEKDLGRLEAQVNDLNEAKAQYEHKNLLEAIAAKEMVDSLDMDIIKWSEIITEIRKTLPKDSRDRSIVEITSYSGSGDNQISMNVKTMPESDEPYMDVAGLIETFDDSEKFKENFVPSISSGLDEDGNEVLSFLLSTIYFDPSEILVKSDFSAQDDEGTVLR